MKLFHYIIELKHGFESQGLMLHEFVVGSHALDCLKQELGRAYMASPAGENKPYTLIGYKVTEGAFIDSDAIHGVDRFGNTIFQLTVNQ